MNTYSVKTTTELTAAEIVIMINLWEVKEWMGYDEDTFKAEFSQSEFHLLYNPQKELVSLARIFHTLPITIEGIKYQFPEFVGFVSAQQKKGYGSELMGKIVNNLKSRNIEALGFCTQELRPFYEKVNIPILYDKARALRELDDRGIWVFIDDDDDILDLTLSKKSIKVLNNLGDSVYGFIAE
ncbi:GNAT family N-acetyltransferase [Flavobacterium sp. '19STA2R22 D10 B1']|uniref:GNAT family N-acetyltransferase n=1 Tax=Flavobacterium aerium TaxID=3037261 RepID=UPI00278C2FB3|nr:GNAT family N-acetyltransferase [Flavobacterium sp. '19STA2R22 D10 B1']